MSIEQEIDEVITLEEKVEKGYFFMDNREFKGPFESSDAALEAALEQCSGVNGSCRAVYYGSVRVSGETSLREPMNDMRQIEAGASMVAV